MKRRRLSEASQSGAAGKGGVKSRGRRAEETSKQSAKPYFVCTQHLLGSSQTRARCVRVSVVPVSCIVCIVCIVCLVRCMSVLFLWFLCGLCCIISPSNTPPDTRRRCCCRSPSSVVAWYCTFPPPTPYHCHCHCHCQFQCHATAI
jgi:hypothetical protein